MLKKTSKSLIHILFPLLLAGAPSLGVIMASASENPTIQVTQLSADLEMKDYHDAVKLFGPLKVGVPMTATFKNGAAKVTVIPIKIDHDTIKLTAELVQDGGKVLYNSTFFTHYNVDADLSEKTPQGDLIYHLKLDPQVQTQQ